MAETLTLDGAVEAMARALQPYAWKVDPDEALWVDDRRALLRMQARAALAALAKAISVSPDRLRDEADWFQESTSYLEAAEVDGFRGVDPVAALLRVLAEASDA
jgi:hypothetical protein